VSVPWIALLVVAAIVVAAAEWSRVSGVVGSEARRRRDRERRKAKLRVVSGDEEFAASVRRDLDRLPTIEERESGRRDLS
jgi:adenine-specific DNA methylase